MVLFKMLNWVVFQWLYFDGKEPTNENGDNRAPISIDLIENRIGKPSCKTRTTLLKHCYVYILSIKDSVSKGELLASIKCSSAQSHPYVSTKYSLPHFFLDYICLYSYNDTGF
ncbi:hypothetical protein CUMW_284510 [Citrus unshiu]|uniref:Uncharacterized protein n=1 Tax=Citrus unshiu TaxID=55188 RepID=A0A2H5N3F6_CITUN|nr:hypothetical protein CUMW_284510 [Citrus unshiu]